MGHASNAKYAAKVAELPRPANRWPRWVVSGGGAGFLRPAPGSWGTVVPAAGYWAALLYGAHQHLLGLSLVLLTVALIAGVLLVRFGYWACCYYREIDPGTVVLDEYAGFCLAAAFLPVPAYFRQDALHLWLFVAGLFILFRATDTLKIPPGRQLEALPWGWGMLLDDLAAGIQANLVAQILVRSVWA